MKKLLAILLFAIPFSASSDAFKIDKLVLLSDTTLTDKPADIFYVGSEANEENYCSITATKNYIALTNGHLQGTNRNQPELSIDCNWGKKYFVSSINHKTMVNVELIKSNESSLISMSIQATLVTEKGELASFSGNIKDVLYVMPEI